VVFAKEAGWTEANSREWCEEHDYYLDGLDETESSYRWRQYDPDEEKFDYRTQVIERKNGKASISLVLGILKGGRAMGKNIEQRSCKTEMRVLAGETGPILEWYPIVYNSLSEALWGFREMVMPGSLTKTLQEADVRALFNHNPDNVLGRVSAGTLKLIDTEKGLLAQVKLPDTQVGRDLAESVRRGDIDQGSFAFRMIRETWDSLDGEPLRRLAEIELVDVSVVTYPAYPETAGAIVRGVLTEAGIDPAALYGVISRSRSGALEESERELMRKAAEVLGAMAAEPVQADHSAESEAEAQARRLAVRRRELELLAISR
jgi:HK97 family phage prohead protease